MAVSRFRLSHLILPILLIFCCSAAHRLPDPVPLPRPKPASSDIKQFSPKEPGAHPETQSTSGVKTTEPVAQPAAIPKASPSIVSLSAIDLDDYQKCVADLTTSGAEVEQPFHVEEQGCVLQGAVVLRSVMTVTGKVEIGGRPKMLCPFALRFSRWVQEVGAPIIAQDMGAPLSTIQTGTAFLCRNRVGPGESKMSEHARGNALDIVSFELRDSRRILIGDEASAMSPTSKALRGLRTSACGYFTTVLGPGSNEAHKTHFHFDLGQHGRSTSYRICE
jgi:hypothetical protein